MGPADGKGEGGVGSRKGLRENAGDVPGGGVQGGPQRVIQRALSALQFLKLAGNRRPPLRGCDARKRIGIDDLARDSRKTGGQ